MIDSDTGTRESYDSGPVEINKLVTKLKWRQLVRSSVIVSAQYYTYPITTIMRYLNCTIKNKQVIHNPTPVSEIRKISIFQQG